MKWKIYIQFINKSFRLVLVFSIAMILGSCTVMKHRYHKWENTVNRTPEGVLDYAEARSWGNGEIAILMVHGFGDGPQVWKSLGPQLAERGYTVRAMRLPGWNEKIHIKRETSLEDWDGAVLSEISTLKRHHSRVVVLAHSLGGCITTVMAQNQYLPVDALVLYAPMFEVSSARSPLFKTSTWFKIGSKLLPDSLIIESLYGDHAKVAEPRPQNKRDPFNPKNIFIMIYQKMDEFENQDPKITLPVRLVLPGEDRVIENARSLEWFDHLSAPSKTLFTDEKAGHVLPLDLDVLAETDRLTLWLNEQGIDL